MAKHVDRLPVIGSVAEPECGDSCGTKAWVSLEESAILAALHALRRRADEVRGLIEEASPAERPELEAALDTLRGERTELDRRREAAYRRKMVMLGHLAEDEVDLL